MKDITLKQFIIGTVYTKELCIIRSCGNAIASFWKDIDDLCVDFLSKELLSWYVINWERGHLEIIDDMETGSSSFIDVRYIDVAPVMIGKDY